MIFLSRFPDGPWHVVEVKGGNILTALPDLLRRHGVPIQMRSIDGEVAFGPVIPFKAFVGETRFPKIIWDWIEEASLW